MTWPKIVTKLAEIDLDDHAPKFKELGFDSMEAFDTSDKGALEIIADMIGLKPGHKVKFVKKFYEQTEAAPPTTPPTAIPIATPAYTVVNLHKAESSTRTGISLVNTANDKLKVESVGEGGVAHGLVAPGDVIIQINDMPAPKNHNEATGMLKALAGDIKLIVHKQGAAVQGQPVPMQQAQFAPQPMQMQQAPSPVMQQAQFAPQPMQMQQAPAPIINITNTNTNINKNGGKYKTPCPCCCVGCQICMITFIADSCCCLPCGCFGLKYCCLGCILA